MGKTYTVELRTQRGTRLLQVQASSGWDAVEKVLKGTRSEDAWAEVLRRKPVTR